MYRINYKKSSLINCTWHALEEDDGRVYDDPANEFWSLGFTRHSDRTLSVELFGPSLKPRTLVSHKGEEYWGVEFNVHVVLKGLSKGEVLDSHKSLPVFGGEVLIGDKYYKIPEYDKLESFTLLLEAEGILAADAYIYQVLSGGGALSERSRQRRFKAATGLTKKQIEQLRRVRHAFFLLQSGRSSSEVALEAGYADQSHMIRAFRLLRGQTPARILSDFLKGD